MRSTDIGVDPLGHDVVGEEKALARGPKSRAPVVARKVPPPGHRFISNAFFFFFFFSSFFFFFFFDTLVEES